MCTFVLFFFSSPPSPFLIYISITSKQNGRTRKGPHLPSAHNTFCCCMPDSLAQKQKHSCYMFAGSNWAVDRDRDRHPATEESYSGALNGKHEGTCSIDCVQFHIKCTQQCTEAAIWTKQVYNGTCVCAYISTHTQNSVCSRPK